MIEGVGTPPWPGRGRATGVAKRGSGSIYAGVLLKQTSDVNAVELEPHLVLHPFNEGNLDALSNDCDGAPENPELLSAAVEEITNLGGWTQGHGACAGNQRTTSPVDGVVSHE